ncbi:twin-arginine translocase TatA/TatE family subunit [Sporosarcina sp. P17b]|nr:twin-arginine translocase TatA/TatE family subunit [Sporosarcina sp. P17b]PIC73474.1 twin-arginine translocase TatA/TatE family subunit [Sporosarcina sp. P17b]
MGGGIAMNLAAIGVPGLIIILVIILILFGPRKLPEIGSAVGKTLSEFKKSAKDIMDDDDDEPKKTEVQKVETKEQVK